MLKKVINTDSGRLLNIANEGASLKKIQEEEISFNMQEFICNEVQRRNCYLFVKEFFKNKQSFFFLFTYFPFEMLSSQRINPFKNT